MASLNDRAVAAPKTGRIRRDGVYAWYVVGVLIVAYIMAFLDRQILSLLVAPIKADLGISDIQIGLLQGLAFAIFYSLCILPAGWLVDRYNRRNILAIGLACWSVMTFACGFADNFGQLFAARMGVGIGEAVLGPAAYSIITNLFSKQRLPLAISVYSIGGSIGAGLAYLFGSLVASIAGPAATMFPILSGLAPWQVAFILVSLPGLPLLFLLLTVREPHALAGKDQPVAIPVRPFLRARARFFIFYCSGIGMLTTVSYANMAWIPTMFYRIYGWETSVTAQYLGLMMISFGTAGILSGGMIAMRLSKTRRDATLRVAFWSAAALVPLCAAAALAGTPWLSLALYAPFTFISTSFVSLGPTSIQLITPDALRGRVNGIALMFVTMIGVSIGPVFIALITERVLGDPMMIHWGLGTGAAFLSFVSAVLLYVSLAHYRRALLLAESDPQTPPADAAPAL
jgi:MFS family permease